MEKNHLLPKKHNMNKGWVLFKKTVAAYIVSVEVEILLV